MTNTAKSTIRLVLGGFAALTLLTACGLRGGLERPAPIIKGLDPAPAAPEPKQEATRPTVQIVQRPRTNEFGGEIPVPAPTGTVQSIPLEDPVEPEDN